MSAKTMSELARECGVTTTYLSNLFTMSSAARNDDRQAIPGIPGWPSAAVRLVRARLVLEEALETVAGLGFRIMSGGGTPIKHVDDVHFATTLQGCTADAIDGACDTIYVAVGTLVALGVPDIPHLEAVCAANDAKFPGGMAITDTHGKYQKPEGWTPPNHHAVVASCAPVYDLHDIVRRVRQLKEVV